MRARSGPARGPTTGRSAGVGSTRSWRSAPSRCSFWRSPFRPRLGRVTSDLAQFPLGAALTLEELDADPHAAFALLRKQEPVSWVPVLDGWVVTRRDLCIEIMRDAGRFTVDDPRFSTAQVVGPSMLSLDG